MVLERISMTPIRPNDNTLTVIVEKHMSIPDRSTIHFEAKGQHEGLVINKPANVGDVKFGNPEMQLEFHCIMNNTESDDTFVENRTLCFWFKDEFEQSKRMPNAYDFFMELINPEVFPKDYVGFVKRIMKQMQVTKFMHLQRVKIDFTTLEKSQQESIVPEKDLRSREEIVRENLQMRLDESFPNVMSMEDLIKTMNVDPNIIKIQLDSLIASDIIQEVALEGASSAAAAGGNIAYRRNYPKVGDEEIREVKGQNHYQEVATHNKPTIAIITNLLCEKMAVDAMMREKTTFVRYKTEGESHVYTIGWIGGHKVISTKLPMVGRSLKEKISSGNTTTRLLGAFQTVQHVFIVGTGGSVPHVSEFEKHSRLGDVVVSAGALESNHVYVYCDKVLYPDEDSPHESQITFGLKYYKPQDPTLLGIVNNVLDEYGRDPSQCSWQANMMEAGERLGEQDVDFSRPPPDTDKFKLKMGGGMTCDVKHPEVPPDIAYLYPEHQSAVRLGIVGSGRPITENDLLRDSFARDHDILAWDAEYDQVLESVNGNRLESFIFIHGMADYCDGSSEPLWQPYASLAAAGFMKSVIDEIPKLC